MLIDYRQQTQTRPCCGQCAQRGMGELALPSIAWPSLDFGDWKTWALLGMGALLIYSVFFRRRDRERRKARRQDVSKARSAYLKELSAIRSRYA